MSGRNMSSEFATAIKHNILAKPGDGPCNCDSCVSVRDLDGKHEAVTPGHAAGCLCPTCIKTQWERDGMPGGKPEA